MATSTLGSGTLVLAGTTSGTTTVTATAVAGTTTLTLPAATDTLVGKATTDTLTNKTLTGAVMNGTVGATTPSTGAFTTLTTSSTVTHNGGTANGVGYLDGSKVLTTGSALVFDGTNLGLGVTPSTWASFKSIDVNTGGAGLTSSQENCYVTTNAYYNAGWKYKFTTIYGVSWYEQFNGQHAWYSAPSGTAGNAISATQPMTLDASGNLLVGTTSSTNLQNNYSFLVGGSLPGAGSACFNGQNGNTVLQVNQTLDDNADRGQIYFYRNESLIGKITSSNTQTLYTDLSDYRLKNTIAPMTGALSKVALLKPCTYKWNVDGSDGQGFIAHELAEVFPTAVSGEKDAMDSEGNPNYQGVDTSLLVATLTAAIQEQQALITTLTARITALESA